MKNFLTIILVLSLSAVLSSCGKRGDLLPPKGYEAPKD
jgi:predicted small lipoprotein YifL